MNTKETMSSADSQATAIANGTCGSCTTANPSDAKFCGGCGQTLTEDCAKCGATVFLTQVFCGECGANLADLIAGKRQWYNDLLAEAKVAASEYRYPEARQILNRITALTDYRFQSISAKANRTLNKVIELEGKTLKTVNNACEKAKQASESGKNLEVIEQLKKIPDHLLNEEARQLFRTTLDRQSSKKEIEQELKKEINDKNWEMVGSLVHQLLELEPSHESAKRVAKKVTAKLIESAKQSSEQGRFDRASEKLNSIPDCEQNATTQELLANNAKHQWIANELRIEPYVSKTLAKLSKTLSDAHPQLAVLKEIHQRIEKLNQSKPDASRTNLIPWKGNRNSWMGGTAAPLCFPQSLVCESRAALNSHPGAFNVAIGLALQAVSETRVTEDFLIRKKSLFSSSRKASTAAWGLDIGTSTVKAIRITREDDQLKITDSFFAETKSSSIRSKDPSEERKSLAPLIEKFLKEKNPDELPVWCNINGSKTVNRFIRLPPVKTKEAATLLDKEIESKIPIPLDELVVTKWICNEKRLPTMGRPAMVSTARREIISRRISLLESLGIKVAGLQSDVIALVNFASHEFTDVWPKIESLNDENSDRIQRDLSRAVCLIDAGASTTHLIVVSAESHWSWTIETGGEDTTFQLASTAKVNRQNAEALKRDPSQLPNIWEQYLAVETGLDTLRSRIETMFGDAMKQDNPFDPVSSWCVGGAWQTHQWTRRIMTKKESAT